MDDIIKEIFSRLTILQDTVNKQQIQINCLKGEHSYIYEETNYTKTNFTKVFLTIMKCKNCKYEHVVRTRKE